MMSMSSSSSMSMVFTTSTNTPLYSNLWTPSTSGGYAGTLIFLIILTVIFRGLLAWKSKLEIRWAGIAQKRRYVLVKGKGTEAGRIDADPDAKTGSLVTAQGVEENVKIVAAPRTGKGPVPFRLSVDGPRSLVVVAIVGVGYLLMLAVMTMNVGYFMSILAGTFIGELAFGRYIDIAH